MFLIETITVIPSRIARKLVNSWLLRSKISRKTSVRNRMDCSLLLLGAAAAGAALAAGAAARLCRLELGHELVLGDIAHKIADHRSRRSHEHRDPRVCPRINLKVLEKCCLRRSLALRTTISVCLAYCLSALKSCTPFCSDTCLICGDECSTHSSTSLRS